MEDRERILNLAPWLFNQHILLMVPYEREKEWDLYDISLVPFWIRIFDVPIDPMDKQLALEVGGEMGKVMAIKWRDKGGC